MVFCKKLSLNSRRKLEHARLAQIKHKTQEKNIDVTIQTVL